MAQARGRQPSAGASAATWPPSPTSNPRCSMPTATGPPMCQGDPTAAGPAGHRSAPSANKQAVACRSGASHSPGESASRRCAPWPGPRRQTAVGFHPPTPCCRAPKQTGQARRAAPTATRTCGAPGRAASGTTLSLTAAAPAPARPRCARPVPPARPAAPPSGGRRCDRSTPPAPQPPPGP